MFAHFAVDNFQLCQMHWFPSPQERKQLTKSLGSDLVLFVYDGLHMGHGLQSFQYLAEISILEAVVDQNYRIQQVFVALESLFETLTYGFANFVVKKRKDLAAYTVEDWQRQSVVLATCLEVLHYGIGFKISLNPWIVGELTDLEELVLQIDLPSVHLNALVCSIDFGIIKGLACGSFSSNCFSNKFNELFGWSLDQEFGFYLAPVPLGCPCCCNHVCSWGCLSFFTHSC